MHKKHLEIEAKQFIREIEELHGKTAKQLLLIEVRNAYFTLLVSVFAFLGAGFFGSDNIHSKQYLAILIILVLSAYIFYILYLSLLSKAHLDKLFELVEKLRSNPGSVKRLRLEPSTYESQPMSIKFWSLYTSPLLYLMLSILILTFVIYTCLVVFGGIGI